MNEQKIEDLKNALREVVSLISQRQGPLPEDLKVLLAQVIEHVATRIQQLRQEEEGVGAPPITPELQPTDHPSSNINSFKYDYKNGDLLVKFQDKYPGQNGPTYKYSGVPKFIYDTFRKGAVAPKTSGSNDWHSWEKGRTPSLGAAMYHLIRTAYPYQKVA
jgi:hypothetical protein